jgi:hypothetical protein
MRTLVAMLGAAAAIACGGGADTTDDLADRAPPEVTISSPPAESTITNEAAASFTITSSEPATICWALDGGAATCSAEGVSSFDAVFPVVAPGAHTLAATGSDAAGNAGGAARHWTVDMAVPTITIEAALPEGVVTTATSATFTLGADEPATICWALDGAAPTCSAEGAVSFDAALASLAEGDRTLAVTVTDAAGNTASAARHWTVDTTAPTITISSPPAEGETIDAGNATFTLGADEPATICWALDGGAETCSVPGVTSFSAVLLNLPDGDHALDVTATDAAGNTASAARHWSVDTSAPTITISAPPAEGARSSAVSPTFTLDTDEPATICWRLDGGAQSCSVPGVTSYSAFLMYLSEGSHALDVTATDAVANHATARRSWTVDITAATVTISSPPDQGATTTAATVAFTIGVDEPATICWRLDGGAQTCSPGGSVSHFTGDLAISIGAHQLGVTVTDLAGNVTTASRSWTRTP